jgi:hypothetical protein
MHRTLKVLICFFALTNFTRPLQADLDPLAYAEATKLGLKLNPHWTPNFVQIYKQNSGFPIFIVIGAIVTESQSPFIDGTNIGDYVHTVFFKKDAHSSITKSFELGRNIDIIFSPTGKQLLIYNNFLAGEADSYVIPLEAFDSIDIKNGHKDKITGVLFFDEFWTKGISIKEIADHQIPMMSTCAHDHYVGEKWIDENDILVSIHGEYCYKGAGQSDDWTGKWTGTLNLLSKKIQNIKGTSKKTLY